MRSIEIIAFIALPIIGLLLLAWSFAFRRRILPEPPAPSRAALLNRQAQLERLRERVADVAQIRQIDAELAQLYQQLKNPAT